MSFLTRVRFRGRVALRALTSVTQAWRRRRRKRRRRRRRRRRTVLS